MRKRLIHKYVMPLNMNINLLCWLAGLRMTHVGRPFATQPERKWSRRSTAQQNNNNCNKQAQFVFQVQFRRAEAACTSAVPNS